MLLSSNDVTNLADIRGALQTMAGKTNNRYNTIVGPAFAVLDRMYEQARQETEFGRRLQGYAMQYGLDTHKYINAVYTDIATMQRTITDVLFRCEELARLITEYRGIYQHFPVDKRGQLEQLLRLPEKLEEAKALFSKLKQGVKRR
jgi:hypothetical protein